MATRFPEQYLSGLDRPPSLEEFLSHPAIVRPLDDESLAPDLTYRDIFSAVYYLPCEDGEAYGEKLAAQPLRYSDSFEYYRPLMAIEFGHDADPLRHNFTTLLHVSNVVRLEETCGKIRLNPYQKTITFAAAGTHDLPEAIVGDITHGQKTPEFRALEAAERSKMLHLGWGNVLPGHFIDDVDAIVGHNITRSELVNAHDTLEVGHLLTQFITAIDAGDICFWLHENDALALSPFGQVQNPIERFQKISSMAIEVSRNTAWLLNLFRNDFWSAEYALTRHRERLIRIQDELPKLLAA